MNETLLCLLFLLVGFILGRMRVKSSNGNTNTPVEVKMPNLNPLKAIKEHRESEEDKARERELNIMLENINNYDGSSYGQKEI